MPAGQGSYDPLHLKLAESYRDHMIRSEPSRRGPCPSKKNKMREYIIEAATGLAIGLGFVAIPVARAAMLACVLVLVITDIWLEGLFEYVAWINAAGAEATRFPIFWFGLGGGAAFGSFLTLIRSARGKR